MLILEWATGSLPQSQRRMAKTIRSSRSDGNGSFFSAGNPPDAHLVAEMDGAIGVGRAVVEDVLGLSGAGGADLGV